MNPVGRVSPAADEALIEANPSPEIVWLNVDAQPERGADVVFHLEAPGGPPFPRASHAMTCRANATGQAPQRMDRQ
jgi:hypothetical protein